MSTSDPKSTRAREPIRTLVARYVSLPVDHVDTDQIIPARYLKVTSRVGLGVHAFADWRYDAAGAPRPDFVLNQPIARGAQVLVAGDNFGCGSSREHAPWALVDLGLRAIVSTSIADIFRSNALRNGLLPVVVPAEFHRRLIEAGTGEVRIDLETRTIATSDGAQALFPIDAFARYLLMNGLDELEFLMQHERATRRYEREHER